MTREQKIELLSGMDTERLLKQFEVCVRNADNAFDLAKKNSNYTIEGIFEDYGLVRDEMVKRLEG